MLLYSKNSFIKEWNILSKWSQQRKQKNTRSWNLKMKLLLWINLLRLIKSILIFHILQNFWEPNEIMHIWIPYEYLMNKWDFWKLKIAYSKVQRFQNFLDLERSNTHLVMRTWSKRTIELWLLIKKSKHELKWKSKR